MSRAGSVSTSRHDDFRALRACRIGRDRVDRRLRDESYRAGRHLSPASVSLLEKEERCRPLARNPEKVRIPARSAARPLRWIRVRIVFRHVLRVTAQITALEAGAGGQRRMTFHDELRDVVEFRIAESWLPSVTRAIAGRTSRDRDVDDLIIPLRPFWLRASIRLLRFYRRVRPQSVGNRCVWDPSCSRHAELALRNLGFLRGLLAIVNRLNRCRPGYGGVDLPLMRSL